MVRLWMACLLTVLLLAFPVLAQELPPVLIGSVGLRDADGSVLYSLLLQSGADDLNELTISSPMPENATYVDAFWTPQAATFVGEVAGTATWTLDSLPANTMIGPFTYRVTFADEATIRQIATDNPAALYLRRRQEG